MIGRIRDWLGLSPDATAEELDEVTQFCAALTEQFNNRFPPQFEISLPTDAAWWAIALYVQFPIVVRTRRFVEADWQAASQKIASLPRQTTRGGIRCTTHD